MKITSIKFGQKVNLGNYESFEFSAEAVIDEEDKVNDVTAKLSDYVDWHARKPLRDQKARQNRAILADEKATPEAKQEAEAWLGKYEARRTAVEAL